MSQAIFGLIGVLLGGVLAAVGAAWVRHRERRAEAGVLARSLRAEIASLLKLVDWQNYAPDLRDKLHRSRTTDTWWCQWINADEDYFSVYRANVSRLGLLSANQAEKVVEFYTLCLLWLENMRYGHEPASRDQAIERLDGNLKILERAVATGYKAVKLLNSELR